MLSVVRLGMENAGPGLLASFGGRVVRCPAAMLLL